MARSVSARDADEVAMLERCDEQFLAGVAAHRRMKTIAA